MFTSSTVSSEVLSQFHVSLDRCLADRSFLSRFYARFILSSDEVAAKFAGVDIKRQSTVLKSSLYMILRAAAGESDGMSHLEEIARTHSSRGYDIPPHLYEHWLECLMKVVGETDPLFDDGVASVWRSVLTPCIDAMIASYGSAEVDQNPS